MHQAKKKRHTFLKMTALLSMRIHHYSPHHYACNQPGFYRHVKTFVYIKNTNTNIPFFTSSTSRLKNKNSRKAQTQNTALVIYSSLVSILSWSSWGESGACPGNAGRGSRLQLERSTQTHRKTYKNVRSKMGTWRCEVPPCCHNRLNTS